MEEEERSWKRGPEGEQGCITCDWAKLPLLWLPGEERRGHSKPVSRGSSSSCDWAKLPLLALTMGVSKPGTEGELSTLQPSNWTKLPLLHPLEEQTR